MLILESGGNQGRVARKGGWDMHDVFNVLSVSLLEELKAK